MLDYIDGEMLAGMFIAGADALESKKEWINELNVFPVPDGDTGTNMTLTVVSAVKDLTDDGPSGLDLESVAKKISMGTLKGARGNSGVIMSQLCRGFSKELAGVSVLDKKIFAKAFDRAVATAYKAVMKPKEGTILTVARCAAEKAEDLASTDISLDDFFGAVLKSAEDTLAVTPDLLPVLKEAGVVDSGGQGLVEFFKGALAAYRGEVTVSPEAVKTDTANEDADTSYDYSVEFGILLKNTEEYADGAGSFKSYLESVGISVNIMLSGKTVKVSLLTNAPGLVVAKAQNFGELTDIKICNLNVGSDDADNVDFEEPEAADDNRKEFGFVSVCAGKGLSEVFKSLNVDCIIEGGQTMNPSTEDIAAAISKVNADHVFVLPNNGNIIMTAKQAALLCEGKTVHVIATKTIPQGISAMMGYVPTLDAEGNEMSMSESIEYVKTLEVTYSIRDAEIDGKKIKKGDYMAIGDEGMLAVNKKVDKAVIEGIMAMVDEDTALVTLYYGADVKEKHAKAISEILSMKLPDADIELIFGGQPVYYYIVSAE